MLRTTTPLYLALQLTFTAGCLGGPTTSTEPAQPVTPAPENPLEIIAKMPTMAEAVTYALPSMSDTFDEPSRGTVLLTAWAVGRMQWSDVDIAKNETSYAKVQKDSVAEHGKRLCVPGNLVQIEVDRSFDKPFYEGLMANANWNLYHFYAVGSTGELVAESYARFCGVVTGKSDYTNSAGGTGHAIAMVGMFDLPENKPTTKP